MQTALYLRVSTAQQRPDLQDDGLHAYAARAGLDIVAIYMNLSHYKPMDPDVNCSQSKKRVKACG